MNAAELIRKASFQWLPQLFPRGRFSLGEGHRDGEVEQDMVGVEFIQQRYLIGSGPRIVRFLSPGEIAWIASGNARVRAEQSIDDEACLSADHVTAERVSRLVELAAGIQAFQRSSEER